MAFVSLAYAAGKYVVIVTFTSHAFCPKSCSSDFTTDTGNIVKRGKFDSDN